ncbi:MFS transporter [Jonesiaceae bacterium BS-20]|uniref:MFS transporter n=1 Tax=Jonesiaceae bacterium BS-20 TaxID=3120821 RepID=A0AAU7DWU5_9MICO
MPKTSRRQSLAYHFDFRQLWIGDALSQVGAQLTLLALPLYAVTQLNASELQMGYLTAAQTIAFLVVGLPAGAWIDRMVKRKVLIWADLVRAVALGTVVVTALSGHGNMAILYGASLVISVATVFFDVAHLSYVPGLVGIKNISEGNTKLQATYAIAAVAVPAIGGMLLRVIMAPVLIAVNVVTYLLSIVFLRRIKQEEVLPPKDSHLPLVPAIAEGLRFIATTPLLNRLVFSTGAATLFSTMGWSMLMLYVIKTLRLSETDVGVVLSASAIGGIIGAVFARKISLYVGEGRIIAISAAATPVLFVGIPLAAFLATRGVNPMIPLIISGFLSQITSTLFNVAQVSFRQRLCPPHLLGRINASFRFIVWGGMPFAGLIGGWVAHQFGLVTMLWLVIAGELAAALPLVFSKFITMRELPGAGSIETVEV